MRKNNKIYKLGYFFIIGLSITIVFCLFIQWYQVKVYDSKPVSISSELESDAVNVRFEGIDDYSDVWKTAIQLSDNPADVGTFYGATFASTIENMQNFAIKDWVLRQNIDKECYLNKFWCGTYEVHQFRDDVELVDTISDYVNDAGRVELDINQYSDVLLVHLMPGDYIVYHPSAENFEDIIEANSSISIGCILYYEDEIDLSDTVITFYNERKITSGGLFISIVVMLAILFVFTMLHAASMLTYHKTKRDVDIVTQSVINGLSHEYKTLWLINIKSKTIQLIRSHDDEEVNKAVYLSKDFKDYETAINHYVNHYVDEQDRNRVRAEVSLDSLVRIFSEKSFFTVNYWQRPYGMEPCYFQMAFTKTSNNGKDENIVLAYRDIDHIFKEEQKRQKQLEEALLQAREANKTKSLFLANMSHEIRTPINAILGMDTMILRESKEDAVKEYARDIKNASNTLLSLVNDILDFSKIESGNMEIIPSEYRLESVISDLLNMIKPKAEEKNLVFDMDFNPNTPSQLYGDEIRVKQIILNLLSNAVKYTKQGSVTWCVDFEKTSPSTCLIKISVKDTGIGIKEEDIQKVASPYMRLDESQTRSIEGTGLGLNIAKNLLNKMGGELIVESVYGEGSVFSFEIEQKIWGEDVIGTQIKETTEVEEISEKFHAPDANILVVDDVEMNLIVVKNLLKRIEINPEMCLSGMEALELSKNKKYDLILLDAMMPKMNGKETLCQIRKQSEFNKDTPIVVLTANAVIGAKEDYLAEGFTNYLSKPVSGQLLEDMIETYLPKEKLVYPDENGFDNHGNADQNSELENLCNELSKLSFIDVTAGITAAGGTDTYINVCENFCDTAASRMQMISDYYNSRDFDNYAIQTHALKSSARLVGALELSELALAMELAGKDKNEKLIDEKTQQLLERYDQVQQGLASVLEANKKSSVDQNKKELTPKKLKRKLADLQELIGAYDFESAKLLFKSFDEYSLPEEFDATYKALKLSMAEVDYDAITDEIKSFLEEEENKL